MVHARLWGELVQVGPLAWWEDPSSSRPPGWKAQLPNLPVGADPESGKQAARATYIEVWSTGRLSGPGSAPCEPSGSTSSPARLGRAPPKATWWHGWVPRAASDRRLGSDQTQSQAGAFVRLHPVPLPPGPRQTTRIHPSIPLSLLSARSGDGREASHAVHETINLQVPFCKQAHCRSSSTSEGPAATAAVAGIPKSREV